LFKTNLMGIPPMTDNMMNMRSLVEKSADADLLRESVPGAVLEKSSKRVVRIRTYSGTRHSA
jgi:hypothetical protein